MKLIFQEFQKSYLYGDVVAFEEIAFIGVIEKGTIHDSLILVRFPVTNFGLTTWDRYYILKDCKVIGSTNSQEIALKTFNKLKEE